MSRVEDAIKKNYLELCDLCNGTGVNPNDKTYKCPKCGGLKVVNHFRVFFEVDVPYTNEIDRHDNAYMILDNVRTIYDNLGLET